MCVSFAVDEHRRRWRKDGDGAELSQQEAQDHHRVLWRPCAGRGGSGCARGGLNGPTDQTCLWCLDCVHC